MEEERVGEHGDGGSGGDGEGEGEDVEQDDCVPLMLDRGAEIGSVHECREAGVCVGALAARW